MLVERERERDQLRAGCEIARRIEADLRQELGAIERRNASATEALRAEKTHAESQLERAREDRAKLQREVAAMKREAEATWAAERVENALLRERINDVAAEVARMTAVLEGPGSPIEAILARGAAPRHQRRPASRRSSRRQYECRGRAKAASPIASVPCRPRVAPLLGDLIARLNRAMAACVSRSRCISSLRRNRRQKIPKSPSAVLPSARPSPTQRSSTASSGSCSAPRCHVAGGVDRIRKYEKPVRVYADNRAKPDRRAQTRRDRCPTSRRSASRHRDGRPSARMPTWW